MSSTVGGGDNDDDDDGDFLSKIRTDITYQKKQQQQQDIEKEEDEYISSRIARMVEAYDKEDWDTTIAVRTELRVCYGVCFDHDNGFWYYVDSTRGNDDASVHDKEEKADDDDGEEEEKADEKIDTGSTMTKDDLAKLTVPKLKDKLRELGLRVGGRKAELIDRLLEAEELSEQE